MERIELIRVVLEKLEKQGIGYCVLRNYGFLLEERGVVEKSEKSVDMVVASSDFKRFCVVMHELGFLQRKNSFSLKHKAFFKIENLVPISFDVQIGGVHWNDICYLDERSVIGNRVRKGWFFVLSENDTFLMLLLHSILGKRYFKAEYQKILLSLREKIDTRYVLKRLEDVFSYALSKELFDLAMRGDFEVIVRRKVRYICLFIIQSPVTFGLLSLRWVWWKRRRFYPLISVIGPDGAGKSTMVEELYHYLNGQGKKMMIVYTGRGRGQILPFGSIGRKYKSLEKQKDGVKKPLLWKRKLLYMFAAPVFAVDLWLRYWFKIFPQRAAGRVVVTDRYCTDLMLMQHVPVWMKRGMMWFFPQPRLTFFLYNTPEVLHGRREEESVAELERQLGLFAVLEGMITPVKIKTTDLVKNREEVLRRVMELMLREWY